MDRIDKRIKEKLLLFFYLKEPIKWKNKLTWWYKLSCLTPTMLGLYIKYFKINELQKYGNFPWELEISLLICGGAATYMGDVVTFGNHSLWKTVDVICSSTALTLIVSILPLNVLKYFKYNNNTMYNFSVVVFLSIYYKIKAGLELKKGIIDPSYDSYKYILYHSAWHYIMCGGSFMTLKYTC